MLKILHGVGAGAGLGAGVRGQAPGSGGCAGPGAGFGWVRGARRRARVPVMSLGFDGPPANTTAAKSTIQSRIGRMSLPDRLKQVQVDMDGRTAILKGTVGSEADKKMMERLLGLEPGVSKIKNELTVTKK